MKKLISLLCILTLLFSCTDYDDVSENLSVGPTLPKKVVYKNLDTNVIITAVYEYDGEKLIASKRDDLEVIYTYTGDLITNTKIYDNNSVLKYEYSYFYDIAEHIIESEYKIYHENRAEKRFYTHNGNGTIDFIYYKGDLIVQNTLYKTGTITMESGEIKSQTVQNHVNPSIGTINYTYDNANNPFKNVTGFNKLQIELDRAGGINKNIVKQYMDYNNGNLSETNFIFLYNQDNFPISETINSDNYNYYNEYFY